VRRAQRLHHVRRDRHVPVHRRYRHQVRGRRARQVVLDLQGEPHRRAHRSGHRRADRELERVDALLGPVYAERLAQHAQLERGHLVVDDHRHVAQHASIMTQTWQEIDAV
jgi:hypothetical protein